MTELAKRQGQSLTSGAEISFGTGAGEGIQLTSEEAAALRDHVGKQVASCTRVVRYRSPYDPQGRIVGQATPLPDNSE